MPIGLLIVVIVFEAITLALGFHERSESKYHYHRHLSPSLRELLLVPPVVYGLGFLLGWADLPHYRVLDSWHGPGYAVYVVALLFFGLCFILTTGAPLVTSPILKVLSYMCMFLGALALSSVLIHFAWLHNAQGH